jgi:hypothetical protein
VHIRVKWKWLTCSSFRSWYLVNWWLRQCNNSSG